jgi:Cu(I)/Ag(I) efflux system membrane fusion protein
MAADQGSDPNPSTGSTATVPPKTGWQKVRLVVKVVELRVRFIALMALTGLVFAYWDTLWGLYDKWTRPAGDVQAAQSGFVYYCPMHPQVVQDASGTCPICGMPLANRKRTEKAPLLPGVTARVELSPTRVQQAGIETVEVGYAPLTQSLTTIGYVAYNERGITNIVSKIPGKTRVVKLLVDFTGQHVAAGQPVAELYSPELAQAIEELLTAARRAAQPAEARSDVARALQLDREALVRASAEKLKRWGITGAQIDEILKTGKRDFAFPILAPVSGHVFKKNVFEGQEIPESYVMFELADLQTVWVQAQVYEHQQALVHEGQEVEASVEAYPGHTFTGKVEFIQPHLDPTTRTVEVRYALDNTSQRLRPGTYATVTLKTRIADLPEFQTRAAPTPEPAPAPSDTQRASLTIEQQQDCPVTNTKLGSMGDPIPVDVQGRRVWTCCDACPPKLQADPTVYSAKLTALSTRAFPLTSISAQKICPVTNTKLGSMGDPVPVAVNGKTVYTCCAACIPKLQAEPARYLARLAPAPTHEVLSIPESAVIDTGTRRIVYVETEPGVFEGRQIVVGPRVGDRFPVLEGLAPGDRVAAAGAFLIDAESRINPDLSAPKRDDTAPAEPAAAPPRSITGVDPGGARP